MSTASQDGAPARSRSKLDPMLRALLVESEEPTGAIASTPTAGMRMDDRGRVQVYVHVDERLSTSQRRVLEARGLEVELVGVEGVVQGWVAPADLEALSEPGFVKRVTPSSLGTPR